MGDLPQWRVASALAVESRHHRQWTIYRPHGSALSEVVPNPAESLYHYIVVAQCNPFGRHLLSFRPGTRDEDIAPSLTLLPDAEDAAIFEFGADYARARAFADGDHTSLRAHSWRADESGSGTGMALERLGYGSDTLERLGLCGFDSLPSFVASCDVPMEVDTMAAPPGQSARRQSSARHE